MARLLVGFALLALLVFTSEVSAGVAVTRHNLSVSGPGTLKASSEEEICIFCHIPHNARPSGPLWNRDDPGSYYTPYRSSTVAARPGQPTGASILCLSCHDGTVALGEVASRDTPIAFTGSISTMPSGPGLLGTDLSDDHPISFAYATAAAAKGGELVPAAELTGPVKLDGNGQLQCTACHDPHDDSNGKFLTVPNRGGALCTTCHRKAGWNQSSHNLSTGTWDGVAPDPWPDSDWSTVADNACRNCHRPHSAEGAERLLVRAQEQGNCLACHNGHVAETDVDAAFLKPSHHPVGLDADAHSPVEPAVVEARHVACSDCHNPHAASALAGVVPGALAGVRGVSIAGIEVDPVNYEYEICFRCHADSFNKPPARTTRQLEQTNVRLEFDTGNPSYHPVAGAGTNPDVPSLLPPYTVNSVIRCTDCHGDDGGEMNPAVANAPHGSNYAPILRQRYETADNTAESPSSYALCYSCHDRDSILSGRSFKAHPRHVVQARTPCNVCHDPHGVSNLQGNAINSSKLVNFDTAVVGPNANGELRYESTGRFAGACYLNCHGSEHSPKTYGPRSGG